MNKSDLIDEIASRTGYSRGIVASVVEHTMEVVASAVSTGSPVRLSGFGTFEPKDRAPRSARNPGTGEQVAVAARRVPVFRASPVFRDRVASKSRGE